MNGILMLVTQHGPTINITGTKGLSTPVQIFLLLTMMSVIPGALLMVTGFTRILIVLGFVRNALGTPTMPPNQVLVGMSLFLSLFVMAPTIKATNEVAVQPYLHKQISLSTAVDRGLDPRAQPAAQRHRHAAGRRRPASPRT